MKTLDITNTDFCVCCGEPVPEGRMVCQACEAGDVKLPPRKSAKPAKGLRKLFDLSKEHPDEP